MFSSVIKKDCEKIINKIDFTKIKNKKILITGASGLLGVYLVSCFKLLKNKNNLEIFVWVKNDIEDYFQEFFEDCKIIQGDITDEKIHQNLEKFDLILHCAGYGQPGKFLEDKIKTILINTNATINLFNNLSTDGKFLFVSTSEIYSGLDYENIKEEEIGTINTNHIRSCYIEGKRCGESICYSFIEKGYDVKIIRLSLAYGPGTKKNDRRVLNSLIQKGLTEDNISLLDDGSSIRTYCYISDVVEMIFNIFLKGRHIVYNVGGESKISILDLSRMIGQKLNKEVIKPKIDNSLAGSPKVVNSSICRYIEEFGQKNFVTLDEGLNSTINWQKTLYKKIN